MLAVPLGSAAVFAARPLISYRALAFGATTADLGVLASAFALFALFGAIPIGRLADRVGGRPILMAGGLTVATTSALLTFADSVGLLALGAAAMGLGQVMLVIGAQTTVTNLATPAQRDRHIGSYFVANSIGQAFGPTVAGYVAGDAFAGVGGQRVFLLGIVVALASVALSWTLPVDRHRPVAGAAPMPRSRIAETLGRPGMRRAMVGSVVLLTAMDTLVAYLPAYGEARAIAPQTIGLAIGALGLSQMVSRILINRLISAIGYVRVLIVSMALPALLVPTLLLPIHDLVLVVIMALIGVNLGFGQPLTVILVALAASPRSRGLAMSLRLVGNRFGQLTIPAFLGATAGQAGILGIVIASSALLGAGALAVGLDPHDLKLSADEDSG